MNSARRARTFAGDSSRVRVARLPLVPWLMLTAGAAGWWLAALSPARAAGGGARSAADSVPAETPLFLSLPDPGRTATAWRSTDLFRLWSDPEVRAFFEKPLSRLPPQPAVTATLAALGLIEPREVFLALTGFDAADPKAPPHLLGGFNFRTDRRAELDALLAVPKARLLARFPGGRAETADHRGQPIEIFRTGRGEDLLASATLPEGRYLISNDLDGLKAALDRTDAASGGALSADADFRAVRARLPGAVETLVFARPPALFEQALRLTDKPPETIFRPEQREQIKNTRALGAATALEGNGKIRDVLFALTPAVNAGPGAPLALPTLPLVVPADAVFYGSATLLTPENAGTLDKFFTGNGFSLESFRAAFGEEAGLWAEWPSNEADMGAPSAFLSMALPVRDRAAAMKVLEKLLTQPIGTARWEKSTTTPDAFNLRGPDVQTLVPTLALGEQNLFFGLQPEAAKRLLDRERQPAGSAATGGKLDETEAFRAAVALVGRTDVAFGFVDTRRLFERAYAALRPMAAVGALVFPRSDQFVDVDKLPPAGSIAKYLSPVAFSQRRVQDGVILESAGPLTIQHLAGLVAGGAVAGGYFAKPHASPTPPPGKKAPAADATDKGR